MLRRLWRIFVHVILIAFLTVTTQVGGLIYIISSIISWRLKFSKVKRRLTFGLIYLISAFLIIPFIAPFFGRTALPLTGDLKPRSYITPLLNRHYVTKTLKLELLDVSEDFKEKYSGNRINYLDANFPFIDGFRLFPHLSHSDGKKIDLSFQYSYNGEISSRTPSFLGYGISEAPLTGEVNYTEICRNKGYWQYDLVRKLTPSIGKSNYDVDVKATTFLISELTKRKNSKILLEPHLKKRWKLNYSNIRFHGCQAVRHDDHIHFQIK